MCSTPEYGGGCNHNKWHIIVKRNNRAFQWYQMQGKWVGNKREIVSHTWVSELFLRSLDYLIFYTIDKIRSRAICKSAGSIRNNENIFLFQGARKIGEEQQQSPVTWWSQRSHHTKPNTPSRSCKKKKIAVRCFLSITTRTFNTIQSMQVIIKLGRCIWVLGYKPGLWVLGYKPVLWVLG